MPSGAGRAPHPASARRGRPSRKAQERSRVAQASPARAAALEACRTVRERDAYAHEVIQATIDRSSLSPEDRAFATLLTLGVAATWGTLDELVDRSLRSPDDVKDDVRDALRISAYELLFLGKEPYAVVDQGVELVRLVAPRAAGLGNAALRAMVREAERFPFGDPETDDEALARSLGFPSWLAARLIEDLGRPAARDLMRASNDPAPLFVAENPLRAEAGEVTSELRRAKARVERASAGGAAVEGCLRVEPARVLSDGRIRYLLERGKMLVSDASSQRVAALALPDKLPDSLLEIGAGRGTKTILLEAAAQRRFGAQIPVHATLDNHAFKTELLLRRVREFGLETVEGLTGDARQLKKAVGGRTFDCVFIDAPCSGLGTLRRHPEIRWRLTPAHIADLARTQLALLRQAAGAVAPGGQLTYATCTVTRQENLDVVKAFLASPEGAAFALASIGGASCFAPALAPGTPDAHFAVRFVRAAGK